MYVDTYILNKYKTYVQETVYIYITYKRRSDNYNRKLLKDKIVKKENTN